MQMIFSGAGIGGSQVIASSAWSGERCAASSASFVSAPAAIGFAQRRIFLSEARREIDDAVVGHRAVSGDAADGVGCETR